MRRAGSARARGRRQAGGHRRHGIGLPRRRDAPRRGRRHGRRRAGRARACRYPGQQRRHYQGRAPGQDDRGPVRCRHRRQPEGRIQLRAGRGWADDRAGQGRDPERFERGRPVRQFRPDQLRGQQVRRDRLHQDLGARARPQGRARQRGVPGLRQYRDPAERAGQGAGRHEGVVLAAPAGRARRDRQHLRLPGQRRRQLRQRRGDRGQRRHVALSPAGGRTGVRYHAGSRAGSLQSPAGRRQALAPHPFPFARVDVRVRAVAPAVAYFSHRIRSSAGHRAARRGSAHS
ncbi:hypothetical protein CBM2633_A110009 [Cupriavidus taiwanensis]|nr:hypothetical protein CBM2633_A110009 [Cupriavidus taiwanensis]